MSERFARRWKWVAFVALPVAVASLTALLFVLALGISAARITDDRLFGTWQSDVERTIGGIRERKPVDDKEEAALGKLFGKLRVTYTPTTCSTELDGTNETSRYEVLGKDKHSVVIREVDRKPFPLDVVELSEFTVIQFEAPDSYWLYTKIGDIREYFKRVR